MQKKKTFRKIISSFLALVIMLTMLPMHAFSKTSGNLYGDINGDAKIDLRDALAFRKHIAKGETSDFKFANADVNTDKCADLKDLIMLQKYLAEWDIRLGPELLTVSFFDGDEIIDVLPAEMYSPLKEVPSTAKSSKANATLLGYYTDKDFTEPFYSEDPVMKNMDVYARYQEMERAEQLNLTSFAQMDQSPELSFDIVRVEGDVEPGDAAVLTVKDGSDYVAINISDEDGDGVYTVNAPEGFHEGCSYELTLADGWIFNGKEETIRTASFSIAMEEVENLQMNDDIIYIKDTDAISYKVDGQLYEELTSDKITENGGTFEYDFASALSVEDILCIYVGTKPTERDTKNGREVLDPAVYVEVSAVDGTRVSFVPLDAESQEKIYNVPDNFPITVEALPTEDTGSVNICGLDRDMYANMMEGPEGTYDYALQKIGVGDFITLYTSTDAITSEEDLYYAKITAYDAASGKIGYEKTTKQAILESMDLYSKVEVAGSDLITEEEKDEIEEELLSQVEQSDFAEEAVYLLSEMVTKTDGFKSNMAVQEYLLSDENGNPLSHEQIQLMNIGGNFKLQDKINLSVKLITKGKELHYGGGTQLAIKVGAKFAVDVDDEAQVVICLDATFVEEVSIKPSVKGSLVTKEILFIPIPIGVQVNASVDIKNYTAFSFEAEVSTVKEGETIEKTTVESNLFDLMDKTSQVTDVSEDYLALIQGLMDKYSEMVERETEWIQIVDEEIASAEVCVFGICIGVSADFIVRMDMSIAIGSDLEYEVGKRYNFWFKIGLFKPSAGSSTMDLLDEHFAFRFYVMGKIGVKAGVQAKLYAGIGSGKIASVGITAELGPYLKLYGFFVYEYTKYRSANMQEWTSRERMEGALYLDFGLYFILGFEASALGDLFSCSYDFLNEEIPLLTAGRHHYYYGNAYEAQEDEQVIVRDEDEDSQNGITMVLPESILALSYVDLETGIHGSEPLNYSDYIYTVSNRNFSVDPQTGVISVTVPEDVRFMECPLTITYRHSKLPFSNFDMSVTVPLVWTNLTDEELNEYYTASVRVGNVEDGYKTVWSKRVLKNQEFDLPDEETIRNLIGWSDAKYVASSGYGDIETEKLTLIQDRVYDYEIDYKEYPVTVEGIQNADGTTRSAVYYAKYGERFDFSDLVDTGTNIEGETYTKFFQVTTAASVNVNGEEQVLDLAQPVSGKMAEALANGVTATASYLDNSVTATFVFNGIDFDNVAVKLKKGSVPTYDFVTPVLNLVESVKVDGEGTSVVAMDPDTNSLGVVNAPITINLECETVVRKLVTITFDSRGGSEVPTLIRKQGTILPVLDSPKRTGYTFRGWYKDNTCTEKFTDTKVPDENITLYAKWTPNDYTVTFDVNGGNELTEEQASKVVTYDDTYGTLPAPTRSHYGFIGWFTDRTGGTEVTSETGVSIVEEQTLYAHWVELKDIPESVFDFGGREEYTYTTYTERKPDYSFNPQDGEIYQESDFTFQYKIQGESEYISGLPVQGGTYDVLVTRSADNVYEKFEKYYTSVLKINYISFDVNACWYKVKVRERTKTGSSHTLDVNIDWSNGSSSSGNMDIDKDWNEWSCSKYGVRPTKFKGQGQGSAGLDRTMYLNVNVYDIAGNGKQVYSSEKYWSAKDPKFDEAISGLPNVDTSANGINVDSCSKIQVNLTTYGVNGALSGLEYTVDNPAVTVKGSKLLIDGSKLSNKDTTINVKCNGKTITIFHVTRNDV